MEEQLLTITQVQEILGVSRAKVYKFFKDQTNPLPVIYISERNPRVRKADLDSWIKEQDEINNEEDEREDHLKQDE